MYGISQDMCHTHFMLHHVELLVETSSRKRQTGRIKEALLTHTIMKLISSVLMLLLSSSSSFLLCVVVVLL